MIIYSLVSRAWDGAVLVEGSLDGLGGNAPQVTRVLLSSLLQNPELIEPGSCKTFGQTDGGGDEEDSSPFDPCAGFTEMFGTQSTNAGYYFHVLHGDQLVYVCLSDDTNPRQQSLNFVFLEQIQTDFSKKYSKKKVEKANAYTMEKAYSSTLTKTMHHYNVNRTSMARSVKVNELHTKIDDLKKVMAKNIQVVLENTASVEAILKQTDELEQESVIFRKRAIKTKRHMMVQHCSSWLTNWGLIAGVVVALVYFLAASICGPTFSRCSAQDNDERRW